MLVLAVGKGNADQTVGGRAHLADRIEFIVDDPGIGVKRLKQIAVEAAKIAIDLLVLLDLFNPVDRRRLAS